MESYRQCRKERAWRKAYPRCDSLCYTFQKLQKARNSYSLLLLENVFSKRKVNCLYFVKRFKFKTGDRFRASSTLQTGIRSAWMFGHFLTITILKLRLVS